MCRFLDYTLSEVNYNEWNVKFDRQLQRVLVIDKDIRYRHM